MMWYLQEAAKEENQMLLTTPVVSSDWMRKNGPKLKYKKFHLSIREKKISFPLYTGVGETLEEISHNPWKLPSVEMFSI